MAKQKYYVVKKGRKPGIYRTWAEAKAQVDGFNGAVYKSFLSLTEAKSWDGKYQHAAKKPTATSSKPAIPVKDRVVLYTDGGSRNTGNVAGGHVRDEDLAAWAFLAKKDTQKWSGSGGEFGATNNRMEIMALLNGLQFVKEEFGAQQPLLVVADSKYVLDAITKNWLSSWQRRGWKKADGSAVANEGLWREVVALLGEFSNIDFEWTKGHADNSGNVFVDELLNKTMDQMK